MIGISALLEIQTGVTAIIGGGGKTTLMFALAEELKDFGQVILCTSTKIWRPESLPVLTGKDDETLSAGLHASSVVCVGLDCGDGKLAAPDCSFSHLATLAEYVLVEADGAKGLPMKAHAPGEPVIPDEAYQTVLVMGAGGFGQRICDAAHRPALYAKIAGAGIDERISPDIAARVAQAENLHDRIFVNQVESDAALSAVKALKALLGCPVAAGSLHKKEYAAM